MSKTILFSTLVGLVTQIGAVGVNNASFDTGKIKIEGGDVAVIRQPRESFAGTFEGSQFFDENRFRASHMDSADLNFGFTNDLIWLQFTLTSNLNADAEAVLEVAYATLDHIDLEIRDNRETRKYLLGEDYLSNAGDIPGRNPAIRLVIKAAGSAVVTMRIRSAGTVKIPINLWRLEKYWTNERHELFAMILLVGGIIFLAVYNLFLWLQLRDIAYAYLAFHGIFLAAVQLVFSGIAGTILWPKAGAWWISNSNAIFSGLAELFIVLFVLQFLRLTEKKWMMRLQMLPLLMAGFSLLLVLLNNYRAAVTIQAFVMASGLGICLFFTVLRMREGFYGTRYLLVALATPMVMFLLLSLTNFGFLKQSFWIVNNPAFGVSLMLLLFSLAVADRIRSIENERLLAKAETLELQLAFNAELWQKVEERTQELTASLHRVEKLKEHQEGDYFLLSQVLGPLSKNFIKSENLSVDFIIRQKREYQFRKWNGEVGGDFCHARKVSLLDGGYACFLIGDAMGKSVQGASGAIVVGAMFQAIVNRNAPELYPEQWLAKVYSELRGAFETFEERMLVSMVMGLVHEKTGFVYYVNSEFPAGILLRSGEASFIENGHNLPKMGMLHTDPAVKIRTFRMNEADVLIFGSDGKDDLIPKKSNELSGAGNRVSGDPDEFLRYVKLQGGDIRLIHQTLEASNTLTDDLSLLSISARHLPDRIPAVDHNLLHGVLREWARKDQRFLQEVIKAMQQANDMPAELERLRAEKWLAFGEKRKAARHILRYAALASYDAEALVDASDFLRRCGYQDHSKLMRARLELRENANEPTSVGAA